MAKTKGTNPALLGVKNFFRKLLLICFKNLLLRKNQWFVTLMEILFPIFGYMIVLNLLNLNGIHTTNTECFDCWKLRDYPAVSESKLNWSPELCKSKTTSTKPEDPFIAVTPDNAETQKLTSLVVAELCNGQTIGRVFVPDEPTLESNYTQIWKNTANFRAAVVFTDNLEELRRKGSKGGDISYKIRLPPGKLPNSGKILPKFGDREGKSKDYGESSKNPAALDDFRRLGPNELNVDRYQKSGFIGLQLAIDRAITKTLKNTKFPRSISLQPFPYPPVKEPGRSKEIVLIGMFFFYSWGLCFMIPSITRNVVSEKDTGISELLRLTGVSSTVQWLGWFIHILTPQIITISVLTLMTFAAVIGDLPTFDRSDPTLFWIILLLYNCATASLGFFICSLCRKPTIATTITQLLWIVSIIAGIIFAFIGSTFTYWMKIGASVFPNMALIILCLNFAALDRSIIDDSDDIYGARWSSLDVRIAAGKRVWYDYKDEDAKSVSNLEIMGVLLADIVLFMGLALYLECVLPSEHGVKRPWYLFNCRRGGRRQVAVAPAGAEQLPPPEVGGPSDDGGPPGVELTSMEGAGTEESKSRAGVGLTEAGVEDKASKVLNVQQAPAFVTSFEPEPVGAVVGVDIQGLVKRFSRYKVAVNGVFLRMFSGDIFALLGHNGAGKTTLISMLTGFFSPTSGTAFVNGYDVRTDLDKARQGMGFCPQHNMLFEWLTVQQQLWLFGMLRGLSLQAAKNEANILLCQMKFVEKKSVLAKKLSGGQKRKLSLGLALIGGTKVVVLDEPTSGMDPQARREIWDILLQLRGERTILLTTHFMEEADVLGDRIGIMADGMLQCCGTAAFLKKYYGAGYTLKLTLKEGVGARSLQDKPPPPSPSPSEQQTAEDIQESKSLAPFKPSPAADAILAAVHKHVPNANYKSDARVDHSNNELFLSLPGETATTNVLNQMFGDLTGKKDKLGINTIGLQQTTMDEVFLKVGSLAEEQKHGGAVVDNLAMDQEIFQRSPKVKRCHFISQFSAVFIKKMIYSFRKWIVMILETIIPLLLFIIAVHGTNSLAEPIGLSKNGGNGGNRRSLRSSRDDENKFPQYTVPTDRPLLISLTKYSNPVTFYFDSENPEYAKKVIGSSGKFVMDVYNEIIKAKLEDTISYKRHHIIAASINATNFVAMFNLYPYHAAPLAINIATNTLLKYLTPNENYRIDVTNQPFYGTEEEAVSTPISRNNGRSFIFPLKVLDYTVPRNFTNAIDNDADSLATILAYLVPMGLLFLVSNFVVPPIEERLSNAKQLQTMTGVSPLVYWGAAFCWDYLFYLVIMFLMLVYLLIFEFALGYGVLTRGWACLVLSLIIMIYGVSAIFLSYVLSFRSNSVAGGFSKVTLIHILLGLFMGMSIPDPDNPLYQLEEVIGGFIILLTWVFAFFGRLFSTYSLVRAIWYFAIAAAKNNNCQLIAANLSYCEPAPYFVWTVDKDVPIYKHNNNGPDEIKIVTVQVPGVAYELFFIVLMGLIYFGLLMFIEFKVWGKIFKNTGNPMEFPPNINDEDVFLEAQRVNMLIAGGEVGMECLVVQNLCKSFGNFAAVSQLHFGVHYGECFGLLGVNGAGKTTAFRMITGDEAPSLGTAFGFGTSTSISPKRFFSNIGYCPQFDAILPMFTGKQMLKLFAGLRGIPFKMRGPEAIKWLTRMGLVESANVQCGRYSGGMKRRLSTAMAMIGDPMLILLDEPTSGVDPVSRRQFWKILDKMRDSGQSIILTSHSMDECEALCSRLGIMVNGQFQCFGGVQHLKNKFAQGYSLLIKLKPDLPFGTPECDANIAQFEQTISEKFQPCSLKDKHQNLLQYHLQNPQITWDVLFKTMEEVKSGFEALIEDYSVNETSLEEVFLAFARAQYPERRANVSMCKQICTCSC